jgi:hypothetical protein
MDLKKFTPRGIVSILETPRATLRMRSARKHPHI